MHVRSDDVDRYREMPDDKNTSGGTGDIVPRKVEFESLRPVIHDPGVSDREAEVRGVRWAVVDYGKESGREDWCDTPHVCYVVRGSVLYEFEDSHPDIRASEGEALALPSTPRHRGRSADSGPCRLFVVDSLPQDLPADT